MGMDLKIHIENREDKKIVQIEGRIDANSASILEKKIAELHDGKLKVLIDFKKVNYLSSAGMRVLLAATKKIKAHGGSLVFCSMGEEILEIIRMAGFDRILSIYPTEKEALAALG
jgi:anti-anti-sigma factor